MAKLQHTFLQGKMNKDLDERLVPKGEYRDAMNIQVATSEGSDVGTVQNILGGLRSSCTYVGAPSLKQLSKCTTFVRVNQQYNNTFGQD